MNPQSKDKTLLILSHSRSGSSARVARESARILSKRGYTVTHLPLIPKVELPYLCWLLLSFIPGSSFPIKPLAVEPGDFERALIVFPKWTLSHPVVNSLLAKFGRKLPKTALIVTCGGWDEERYLESYRQSFTEKEVEIIGGTTFRKSRIPSPLFSRFLREKLGEWF